MEARWNRVGSYPLFSYFNGKGNELKLHFFEGTGGMLVAFTNPSAELVKICGDYCAKEMAANGRDIKDIFVNIQHMYSSAVTRYVVDAIFQQYSFDDNTKKEIQDCMNSFYSRHQNSYARYGVFGVTTPTSTFNSDQYWREARFKMEMSIPSRAWS